MTTASRYSGRRTLRNGVLSAAQVVVVGLTLLLAYRLALTEATREEFGLYATLFALGTLTQLGTLGFAGGAARHMADAVGEGQAPSRAQVLVSTVVVSTTGSLAISLLLWGGLELYRSALDPRMDVVAGQLVPVVVAAAFVTPVSTAVQGLVDGLGQAHVRSIVVIAASLLFYAMVAFLLGDHGVASLAYAALAQQALIALLLLVVLILECRPFRTSWGWSRSRWRDMRAFNLKFQVMTIPALALEPLAKLLLGAFAGFGAVATFEIANRLMQQVNAVILAANQAVVPLIAFRSAAGDLEDIAVFRRLYETVWTVSLTAFAAALVVLVPLGTFVFGESDPALLGFGLVLAAGWLANSLAGPAYFISVTTNRFSANVLANYLMVGTPAVLGALLGPVIGGIGVALAIGCGLLVASYIINRAFLRDRDLSWTALLSGRDALFAGGLCVLVGVSIGLQSSSGPVAVASSLIGVTALGAAGLARLRRGPVGSMLVQKRG